MDNHPIPQDVTNFQFRLIGDMTLKQFGYIAGGVIFAWVMLASPLFFLFKLIFAGGCVLAAVVLAFVPIEGRPSDLMVLHFIKALFNPTQFIYQKLSQQPSAPLQKMQITTPPPQQPQEEKQKEEKVELQTTPQIATAAVQSMQQQEVPAIQPSAPVQTPPKPLQTGTTPESMQKEAILENQVTQLSHELEEAKEQEKETTGAQAAATHQKVVTLEQTLQELMQQKEDLEKKLVELQKALTQKNQQVYTPSVAEPIRETQHVRKIPKQMAASTGTPLVPDVANLITGVIKDPRGNVLPNILIEVKDKDGNPVRAFKTNQLGQFAAATPLATGLYTISFEDPSAKQSFDSVEITADGQILLPLEIISVDERERLRKELFGK